jgi:hypothetical protein
MNKSKSLMPIINIYLALTIVYYFFGRYDWNIPSSTKLVAYLVILVTAMNFGYYNRIRINFFHKKLYKNLNNEKLLSKKIRRLLVFSSLVIIIFQIVWVVVVFGKFSIGNVISSLGENYYKRLLFSNESNVFIMQIRTLFWGVTLFAYPIGFTYFKQLNLFEKLVFIIALFTDILASLNMGIGKNISDIIFIFILCMLVKGKKKTNILIRKKNKSRFIKIIIVFVAFLIMFNIIQQRRDTSTNLSMFAKINPYYNFSSLRENTIFDVLSLGNRSIVSVIDKLGAYASHGYTGLAYALELPFKNTYGLGFSRALMGYANQYLGINVTSMTYMSRIETAYGWPDGIYWPTAFTWFASAVSFWLLPFIVWWFGYIIAHVEKRYKACGDVYSLTLLSQLFIMAIYLPGNAQLFQSRASFFGIIAIIIAYFFTRKRYRTYED